MRAWIFLIFFVALASARAAEPGASFAIAGFSFQTPAGWEAVAPSGMRKAELRLRGPGGEANCVFFFFGSEQGGDVKSNVERWAAQFTGAEDRAQVATQAVGANRLTLMRAQGIFNSAMPGAPSAPQKDYAMLGAILEGGQGKVFIKLTGPLSVVQSAEVAFTEMTRAAASGH